MGARYAYTGAGEEKAYLSRSRILRIDKLNIAGCLHRVNSFVQDQKELTVQHYYDLCRWCSQNRNYHMKLTRQHMSLCLLGISYWVVRTPVNVNRPLARSFPKCAPSHRPLPWRPVSGWSGVSRGLHRALGKLLGCPHSRALRPEARGSGKKEARFHPKSCAENPRSRYSRCACPPRVGRPPSMCCGQ